MLVSEFDFELPEELIAQEAAPRGASRLMVLDRRTGALQHSTVAELPVLLAPGDLLVVNDTRVFAARLLGRRVPSGGAVECLLLGRRAEPDADGCEVWDALMHPGQKLKPGALVRFEGDAGVLMAEVVERHFQGRRTVRLWVEEVRSGVEPATHASVSADFFEVRSGVEPTAPASAERSGARRGAGVPADFLIDALGHIPLPPYIKRSDTPADRERYQTIFARQRGSIAAPTAGLHFTPELIASLERRGVEHAAITLHVGYGTFKPVRVESVEAHVVDPEPYDISEATATRINCALDEGRRVVAVGTTTTRALEDAARRGGGRLAAGRGSASVFIYPGFDFVAVGALVTNFHLPRSSLLMLVSAFAGRERILAAYKEAVAQRYRFYSYGDAMLIV